MSPYISDSARRRLETEGQPRTAGELNYNIARLALAFLPEVYGYDDLNEVIGVLECVKQEFYRRVVVPYEDEKKRLNGDVF